MAGSRHRSLRVVAAMLIAQLLGCASNLVMSGEGAAARYRHRKLGYEISVPPSNDAVRWQRMNVDGADLSFRTRTETDGVAGASTMSLQSDCRRTSADVAQLARHLRIGLQSPVVLDAGPTRVDGSPAWQQVFDTSENGGSVRVKTVTTLSGDCTFDWVLVARGAFEPLELSFDAWWGTFRRLAPEHAFARAGSPQ